jgi:predicted RNA-binding protein with PIN domain
MRLLVDAMNVIGTRPDGWWRDRDAAVRRLVARLAALAVTRGDDITVAVDGRARPDLAEGVHDGVTVLYARRSGRNGADERILEEIRSDPDPSSLTVLTSDRELARRARQLGATVRGATSLAGG